MAFRDRVREAARRVRRRLAGASPLRSSDAARVDETVIPRVVDGSGDTPGPNHPTDIGRTWAAAQILGGEGVRVVDVRSPAEWASGHVPGALLLPGEIAATHVGLLGDASPTTTVIVYDALDGQAAGAVAAQLREAGWARARRLVGGFAEWVEEGEEVVTAGPDAARIGRTARLADGRDGVVWRVEGDRAYVVLRDGAHGVTSVEDLA